MTVRITRVSLHVLGKDIAALNDTVKPIALTGSTFFRNNWESNVEVETAWMTDIVASSGTLSKERAALRSRPVRFQTVQFTALRQKDANRLVQSLMRFSQDNNAVPLYSDRAQLTAPYTGGEVQTFMRVNTQYKRFYRGQRIGLVHPDFEDALVAGGPSVTAITLAEILNIDVSEKVLTLKFALEEAFPAGTYIYPMMDAEVIRGSVATAITGEVIDVKASFQEKSGMMSLPSSVVRGAAVTFQANDISYSMVPGDIIFDKRITGGVSLSITRDSAQYTSGRAAVVSPRGARPTMRFEFDLVSVTRAEWWTWLRFFDTVKGAKNAFWVANPQNFYGLVKVNPTGVEITRAGDPNAIKKYLPYVAIVYNDGSILVREIFTITNFGDNWSINFNVGEDLPAPAIGVEPVRVTTAHICTLEHDYMSESWITDETVSSTGVLVESLNEADVPTSSGTP